MMPIDFHKAIVIAVDPGLRGSGLAIFKNGVLLHAQYVVNDNYDRGPKAHMCMAECVALVVTEILPFGDAKKNHIIVEFPQHYPGPGKPIDPNDLLDIAGVASACMTAIANWLPAEDDNCRWTLPRAWKGNIKKEIMTNRILASLTDRERSLIVSSGAKDHNTVDAVGLGLWQLGRLNRRVLQ